MARRTRRPRTTRTDEPPLVQWEQNEPQVHVVDWRKRANDWGLRSVDPDEPSGDENEDETFAPLAGQLLDDEEPEARLRQRVPDEDEDGFDAEELTREAPESGVGGAEPDSVRRYLAQIGRTALLTAAQEAQLGQGLE